MPESRARRKDSYTPPPAKAEAAKPSPRWWVVTMVGLMVLGLIYLVVTYLSQLRYPIGALGYWNVGVGFGIMMVGFAMTTRWR